MNNDQVRAKVVEKILASMEDGIIPWTKSWKGRFPTNPCTKRLYKGINVLLLGSREFSDHRFMSFKQVKQMGGEVKKGSKLSTVVFSARPACKDQPESAKEAKTYYLLRYYPCIVNVEQTTGLLTSDGGKLPTLEELCGTCNNPIELCENIVKNMPKKPRIETDPRAAYLPLFDYVMMPLISDFTSAEAYYKTLFHELMHATEHETRCGIPQGTRSYAYYELRAEIGAAMLCSYAGIEFDVPHVAAYIDHWKNAINGDHKLIITASSEAVKGVDYILGMGNSEVNEEEEEE